jgi:hypothetical protein
VTDFFERLALRLKDADGRLIRPATPAPFDPPPEILDGDPPPMPPRLPRKDPPRPRRPVEPPTEVAAAQQEAGGEEHGAA